MINDTKNTNYGKMAYLKTQEIEKNLGKNKIKIDTIQTAVNTLNTTVGGIDDAVESIEDSVSSLQSTVDTLTSNMTSAQSSIQTLEGTVTELQNSSGSGSSGGYTEDDFFMYVDCDTYTTVSRNYSMPVNVQVGGTYHIFCKFRIFDISQNDTFSFTLKKADKTILVDSIDLTSGQTYDGSIDKIFLNAEEDPIIYLIISSRTATTFKIKSVKWNIQGNEASLTRTQTPTMGITAYGLNTYLVYRITDGAIQYEVQNWGSIALPGSLADVYTPSVFSATTYYQIIAAKLFYPKVYDATTSTYIDGNRYLLLKTSHNNLVYLIDTESNTSKAITSNYNYDFSYVLCKNTGYNIYLLTFERNNNSPRIRLTRWLNTTQKYYCNIGATKVPNIANVTQVLLPECLASGGLNLPRGICIFLLESNVVRWVKDFVNYANMTVEDLLCNGAQITGTRIYVQYGADNLIVLHAKEGNLWKMYYIQYYPATSEYVATQLDPVEHDMDNILYHNSRNYLYEKDENVYYEDFN